METTSSLTRKRAWLPAAMIALISALYFLDTMLRASLKAFWFDELFTVYLCRLPSFHATWTAVLHGSDFNPPLLYLLTRGSQHLFGEGPIGTRLPAIVGFWIFGVCLYLFTARRLGRVPGLIAALAPMFTLAHNYAYEARAHAMVLAWFGLMLVCWQRSREQSETSARHSRGWTLGLGLSFLGALLTHVYAIYLALPFFLVEVVALLRRRRPSLLTCAALLAAMTVVAPLYLRMLKTFRTIDSEGGVPLHNSVLGIFGSALLLMMVVIALSARDRAAPQRDSYSAAAAFTADELILAYGSLLLPVIGAIGVAITHGPSFDRYFLACTGGFALILAQSVGANRPLLATRLAAAMLILVTADIGLGVRALRGADLMQIEPVSHFRFSPSPARPLERDAALRMDQSNLDVLVTEQHNYLYLYYYAPEPIRRRLVFGALYAGDFVLVSDRRLAKWANLDLRTATYAEFFATHNDFLVYSSNNGTYNGGCGDCLQLFLNAGYTLRSVQRDADSLLEHFSR